MANCGLLLNDGSSFIELNGGGFLLLNDSSCSVEPGASTSAAGGAGGFAASWDYDAAKRRKREIARVYALQRIRSSTEYRSLQRKLAMLEEHLSDKPLWYVEDEIKNKIEQIKLRIRRLEDIE